MHSVIPTNLKFRAIRSATIAAIISLAGCISFAGCSNDDEPEQQQGNELPFGPNLHPLVSDEDRSTTVSADGGTIIVQTFDEFVISSARVDVFASASADTGEEAVIPFPEGFDTSYIYSSPGKITETNFFPQRFSLKDIDIQTAHKQLTVIINPNTCGERMRYWIRLYNYFNLTEGKCDYIEIIHEAE